MSRRTIGAIAAVMLAVGLLVGAAGTVVVRDATMPRASTLAAEMAAMHAAMAGHMGIENMGGPSVGFVPALPTPTVTYGAVMQHDDRTGAMTGFAGLLGLFLGNLLDRGELEAGDGARQGAHHAADGLRVRLPEQVEAAEDLREFAAWTADPSHLDYLREP